MNNKVNRHSLFYKLFKKKKYLNAKIKRMANPQQTLKSSVLFLTRTINDVIILLGPDNDPRNFGNLRASLLSALNMEDIPPGNLSIDGLDVYFVTNNIVQQFESFLTLCDHIINDPSIDEQIVGKARIIQQNIEEFYVSNPDLNHHFIPQQAIEGDVQSDEESVSHSDYSSGESPNPD